MSTLEQRLEFARTIAHEAGDITLRYFGKLNADQRDAKGDGTPVTIADRASETHLRERISEAYPDDAILGEEFEDRPGSSGYQWVIDPIDGTISFVHGVPLYGTMLACLHKGTPVLGVIWMPALSEGVYAATGLGCWLERTGSDPVRSTISQTEELGKTLLNTTSMSYFLTPELRALYEHLDRVCKHTRGWSDAYAWVLLASGRVDAVIEPELKIWDFAAAIPIILESGGIWSDLAGKSSMDSTQVLAANPALHAQLLDQIRAFAPSRLS